MRLHGHVRIQMIQGTISLFASIPTTFVHSFNFFIATTRPLVLLGTRDRDEGVDLEQYFHVSPHQFHFIHQKNNIALISHNKNSKEPPPKLGHRDWREVKHTCPEREPAVAGDAELTLGPGALYCPGMPCE